MLKGNLDHWVGKEMFWPSPNEAKANAPLAPNATLYRPMFSAHAEILNKWEANFQPIGCDDVPVLSAGERDELTGGGWR